MTIHDIIKKSDAYQNIRVLYSNGQEYLLFEYLWGGFFLTAELFLKTIRLSDISGAGNVKTGAIIIASGKKASTDSFQPMIKIGNISAVLRLIKTFQLAGVSPIVLVAGSQSEKLEKHVSRMGIVYLRDCANACHEMIDYAKIGFAYLKEICDQVLVAPVDVPLFTMYTVQRITHSGALLANPVFNGKRGHPLLISSSLLPFFLQYQGENGLKGAMDVCDCQRTNIDVSDAGVLYDVNSGDDYQELLEHHNQAVLRPIVKIQLAKEEIFFEPGTAQLLSLIENTGSVRLACEQMTISYSKGWKIISIMEEQLGVTVVKRQQGGKYGGSACLSERGKTLLKQYYAFDKACKEIIQQQFDLYLK